MAISIAMIALGSPAELSASAIQADLKSTWPDASEVGPANVHEIMISFKIGNSDVVIGRMPEPIPWNDLQGACEGSWQWPDAAEQLKSHTQHLLITISDDNSAIDRAMFLTRVTAAIIATCSDTIGVFWCNANMVIASKLFRQVAVAFPTPVPIWIDFIISENPDGTSSGYTMGLAALDLMEFETLNSYDSPGMLRDRLVDFCFYLIANGPIIDDGDTIGFSEVEKVNISHTDSAFGLANKVMRLDFCVVN